MASVIFPCPSCEKKNRIPAARLQARPRCGSCQSELVCGAPVAVDEQTLPGLIAESSLPLLVDFWAPWCGPCRMMAPAFEQAARQLEPSVRLVKVNTDEAQTLGAQLGIRSIPTLAFFAGGQEVARQAGAMGAGDIVRWAQAQLARA